MILGKNQGVVTLLGKSASYFNGLLRELTHRADNMCIVWSTLDNLGICISRQLHF